MKWLKHIFTLVFFGSFNFLIGQTALITGVIFDAENKPIANVNISSGTFGTTSNADGFYILQVASNKEIAVTFLHIVFKNIILKNSF